MRAVARDEWQELLREASSLRRAGRFDAAKSAYQRVLEANPDLPDSWFNLGWLQRRSGEFEEALQSYQRAIDLGIPAPEEANVNRAVIYSDHLFRPADAELELTQALNSNPDYLPALLNLGNLREDLGDREGARAAYEGVLAIETDHALALARLAGVSHSAELDVALERKLRA